MMTRHETAAWLAERDHFCILTHRKPDGDTVGSSAALCRLLRKMGKQAAVLKNPELTPRYAALHEGLTVDTPAPGDILVCVDVASPTMLPQSFQHLKDNIALRIDHHATADSFTEKELVDPGAGACAEIIYDLMVELWAELDPETATALYVGTSTDTGCFRYSNTTGHTFIVAAAAAAAGAPVYELNQTLFETNSLARLRIQGWMVEHTKLLANGKIAVCAIPKAVEEELGATEDDLDNISSFPRTIEGVCIAATLRENQEDGVKVSVRAVPGWDAGKVCARFGGGGHQGAAGASMKLALPEATKAMEQALLELENR